MEWAAVHEVQLSRATAAFLGLAGPASEASNVDVEVTLDDGSRWSATLLTLDDVAGLMKRWSETGEHLGGRYCEGDDLVIMSEPGLDFMVALLDDLVTTGDYRQVLKPLGEQ